MFTPTVYLTSTTNSYHIQHKWHLTVYLTSTTTSYHIQHKWHHTPVYWNTSFWNFKATQLQLLPARLCCRDGLFLPYESFLPTQTQTASSANFNLVRKNMYNQTNKQTWTKQNIDPRKIKNFVPRQNCFRVALETFLVAFKFIVILSFITTLKKI